MPKEIVQTMTASISLEETEKNLKFAPSELIMVLRQELDKRLGKKGIGLDWRGASEGAELRLRFAKIDEGNQMLRYMLPGLGAATVAIEGEVGDPQNAHAFQKQTKAYIGLLGGNPKTMLKLCTQRLAKKVVAEVMKTLR